MKRFRLTAEATRANAGDAADVALLAEVDEHLRRAMSVQPSPDFARSVRARIEERQLGGKASPAVWRWAAAAACVVAIAIGWRIANTTDGNRLAAPERSRPSADVRLAAVPAPPAPVEPHAERTPPARVSTAQSDRRADTAAPEIIVPEENARAVARLLALARSGSINEEQLTPVAATVSSPTLDTPLLGVAAIVISDIEIDNVRPTSADRQE